MLEVTGRRDGTLQTTNLNLQGNLSENWRTWLRRYKLFPMARCVAGQSEEVQCATFLYDAMKVSNTFVFLQKRKEQNRLIKTEIQRIL